MTFKIGDTVVIEPITHQWNQANLRTGEIKNILDGETYIVRVGDKHDGFNLELTEYEMISVEEWEAKSANKKD